MPLISVGSLDQFNVRPKPPASSGFAPSVFIGLDTVASVTEMARSPEPVRLEFAVSKQRRGLALKSLTLRKNFNGFLRGIWSDTNNVYFTAWAWDLSGKPVVEYPGGSASPESVLIPLTVGKVREFIGDGINLYPARKVTAGLAIRIMIWQSDKDLRDAGKTLKDVANTVSESKLSNVLSVIALAGGPTVATLSLVKDAAVELGSLIGTVLKANSDDYVDFYEGYYSAESPWKSQEERYEENASEIVLRTTS